MPLVSIREYGRMRGVSHNAVRKAIESGRLRNSVVQSEGGKKLALIDSDMADQEWPAGTQEAMKTQGSAKPASSAMDDKISQTYAQARALRENYAARLAKLEFEIRSGKYVDAKEVEQTWTMIATNLKTKILGIPSKAKQRIPDLTDQAYAELEVIVRDALTDLADSKGLGE